MNVDRDDILGVSFKRRIIKQYSQEDMTPGTYETDLQEVFPGIVANTAEAIKTLRAKRDGIYHRFFPKLYYGTERFGDWRRAHLISAIHVVGATLDHEYYASVQAATNSVHAALRWYGAGMPSFFVAREFYDAVRQTEIPSDFDFKEMEWPFEAYTFVLPRNVLFYRGEEVPFISVAVCKGREVITDIGKIEGGEYNKLIISTSFGRAYFAPSFHLDHLDKFYNMDKDDFFEMSKVTAERDPDAEFNDASFVLTLLKIALKLTVAMEAVPEQVTKGSKLKTTRCKKNAREVTEVWSPNVIGERFKVEQKNNAEGSHASPRMHWRRGHFRRQFFGKGRAERRTVWIRPMIVAAPSVNP